MSGTVRGKVYVPKVEEVIKPEYDSDDEDEKKKVVEEDPAELDDEYRWNYWSCKLLTYHIILLSLSQALQMATAGDIQDIADILGVTFQEHCVATALKVKILKGAPSNCIDCPGFSCWSS